MAATIAALLPEAEALGKRFDRRLRPPVMNLRGVAVGSVRPVEELVAALRAGDWPRPADES